MFGLVYESQAIKKFMKITFIVIVLDITRKFAGKREATETAK